MRWHRRPSVQLLLYLLLRSVILVIDLIPSSRVSRAGRILGRLIRRIDRRHARIAARNLERAREVCPAGEIPSFVERVYEHIGLGFVELLQMKRLMERRGGLRCVRLKRFDRVGEALARGRGLIVVIGHLGNWELAGLAVAQAGIPLHSLARPIDNPWVDRYLHRFRTRTGQSIIPKYQALGRMIQVLRKNEVLVIQVDQDARHHGVHVNFFGRPASTHRSPALLSLKYGTPVVVADIYREGRLHHCALSDPILPDAFRDHADPVRALTQAYTSRFEEFVRAHPEQWFWVHDRWRTAPEVEPPTGEGLRPQAADLPAHRPRLRT